MYRQKIIVVKKKYLIILTAIILSIVGIDSFAQNANDFIILPNGILADTRISESTVDVILRHFQAIENGDLTAFRSTLSPMQDGVDLHRQLGLIFRHFGDIAGVSADMFAHAMNTGVPQSIIDKLFYEEFAPKNRNSGMVIQKMEIVTDHIFRIHGFSELIRVVLINNDKIIISHM